MKKIFILSGLIFLLFIPTTALAWGVEIAGGSWYQSPSGNLSFDKTTHADDLDLEDDLNYDDKWQPSGRLKIDMPSLIPNIYIMATPMKWDESGNKDVSFKFGGETFQADVDFDSKLKMNHLDVALFYGLPFIKTATAGVLNIDLGLNFRLLDVKAEIKQKDLGLKESESYFLPLPMVYGAMQIVPVDWLGLEFEGRGVAYSSNYYVSLIGRLKVKPFGPFFVAGGYRYDTVKIDYQDIDIDTEFEGPFAEAGLDF
jgi:outer membrane protein